MKKFAIALALTALIVGNTVGSLMVAQAHGIDAASIATNSAFDVALQG